MSTEKTVEEIDYQQLTKDLRIKSGTIAMGERIAWGSDSGIMDAAADAIDLLTQTLQAERTKRDEVVEAERKRFGKILSELEHSLKNSNGSKSEITGIIWTAHEALTQPNNQN